MEDVDVFTYESVDDLEATIDTVVDRQRAYNQAVDELLEQADRFTEYRHDPERFESLAKEVASGYGGAGSSARITHEYAQKELDAPEQARNWVELENVVEESEDVDTELHEAYEELWQVFGYDQDDVVEEYEGMTPFVDVLWAWETRPHTLFRDLDAYDGRGWDEVPGPTLARLVDDPDTRWMTGKQRDDVRRETDLDRILDRPDREPGYMEDLAYPSVWEDTFPEDRWRGDGPVEWE